VGGLAGVALFSGLLLLRGQTPTAKTSSAAEGKKEPPILRTSGSATVRVKPDAARLFFAVQTQAVKIKEARLDNNSRVHTILEALAALKMPDLKTKTSDVQVDILYGRSDGSQLPPITGYRISTTFTMLVQQEDPAKLGALASRVLDAALDSGATSVQQIAFLRKDGLTQARRKALTQAVEDALANARALAAGAKKGQVECITIDGPPMYHDRGYFGSRNAMVQSVNVAIPGRGPGEAALVVGDLEVTCQVNVTCTY
jgi:uncharacterized protein YggE